MKFVLYVDENLFDIGVKIMKIKLVFLLIGVVEVYGLYLLLGIDNILVLEYLVKIVVEMSGFVFLVLLYG